MTTPSTLTDPQPPAEVSSTPPRWRVVDLGEKGYDDPKAVALPYGLRMTTEEL